MTNPAFRQNGEGGLEGFPESPSADMGTHIPCSPHRIQLKRQRGWRMPPNTLKVDRSTSYGNDFMVADYGSAEVAVDLFDHDLDKFECFHPEQYRRWIEPLVGKNLACWCKPDATCHADVLLRRAAEYEAARDMGSRVAAQVVDDASGNPTNPSSPSPKETGDG